ncbi:acyl-CoA N-acyltransferase [Podospora conica]|nr:acyl-CoA N-acyltransferase [Schizothecium conicum]
MSRAPGQQQQPSIRSFFQPRQLPKFAAPPTTSTTNLTTTAPPPPAPPLPLATTAPSPPTIPLLPPPPSLPQQASILPISASHVPALRRINSLLLSVPYPDSFYSALLDPLASGLLSRVILWRDDPSSPSDPKVIGGIVCRLEPNPSDNTHHTIYLQSLALLSPYRSQGLAAAALEHVIASAALLPPATWDVRSVYAHVWTENDDGLRWYAARGFQREGREPVRGYYYKLRPDTAWVVRRLVGAGAEGPPPPGPQGASRGGGGVVAAAVNLPPIGAGAPPPPRRPSAAPSPSGSTLSFQNLRPETEWNDLPEEMVKGSGSGAGASRSQLVPPPPTSGAGSATSSRSSSAARKKKERAYPTAAFGN